jgi:hypothetical protein
VRGGLLGAFSRQDRPAEVTPELIALTPVHTAKVKIDCVSESVCLCIERNAAYTLVSMHGDMSRGP